MVPRIPEMDFISVISLFFYSSLPSGVNFRQANFCKFSHLFQKYEEDSKDKAEKSHEMIPLQCLSLEEDGNQHSEHSQ